MTNRILTEDHEAVICERHYGWEKAEPSLLARVFGVPVQRISAILRKDVRHAASRKVVA